MANTRRESTASSRSENTSQSAGSSLIPALGFSPPFSTAVEAICQLTSRVALPIREPKFSHIANAVDTAFALHSRTNGSTVSLIHGSMVAKKLFSVSIYPSRSITLWERPSREKVFEYTKANLDLLLMPDHALGTWFDDWKLVHVLDVVILVPDRNAALDLGLRFNQLAIFDLEARREIAIPRPCRESAVRIAEAGND